MRAFLAAALFAFSACASAASLPQLNIQFEKLEDALHLTPPQKEQYDAAVGATKRMLLQLGLVAMQVKEKIADELAKPNPDLGVLMEARRAIVEDGSPLRREMREEWGKLYAMLDRDQVAILRRFIEDHLDNAQLLHEFMRQALPRPQRDR